MSLRTQTRIDGPCGSSILAGWRATLEVIRNPRKVWFSLDDGGSSFAGVALPGRL
jgi:hypothetical protein